MSYFNSFPKIEYPFDDRIRVIPDISVRTKLDSSLVNSVLASRPITVLDGERPDNLSFRLYGTTRFWWTFFLVNDSLAEGYIGWPKSGIELSRYVLQKYNTLTLTGYRTSQASPKDITNMAFANFVLGEILEGQTSGAKAKVVAICPTLNQIHLELIEGTFDSDETLLGLDSGDIFVSNANHTYTINETRFSLARYANPEYQNFDFVLGEDVAQSQITYFELESQKNIARSNLRYVRPEMIDEFASRVERLNEQ